MSEAEQLLIVSDTTLRDGVQMRGARLTPRGRTDIASALERAGVRSLEIGFPAVGPAEIAEMREVARSVRRSLLLGLCRATEPDVDCAQAAFAGVARVRCGVNVFLGTSPLHRARKLGMTPAEIIDAAARAVSYARRCFAIVSFSAEDASRTEFDFLCEVYRAAVKAGATAIGFPDTVGILTPEEAYATVVELRNNVLDADVKLAVHFHNDLGLATANTLAAARAGVDIVQCTVNGIGERAGNAALEEVVTALVVHRSRYRRRTTIDTSQLCSLSQLVSQATGTPLAPQKPITGDNMFVTCAGLHQDGLLKEPMTYLPFRPGLVGAAGVKLVLERLSGRAAAAAYLASTGEGADPMAVDRLLRSLKDPSRACSPLEVTIDAD